MSQQHIYSVSKVYRKIIIHFSTHSSLKWLWKSSCQPKHKVFFWLMLQDRLNTRGQLRRKHMILESHDCELCILHMEETSRHLFIKYNFANNCWRSICINILEHLNAKQLTRWIKRKLQVPFYMDIIIIMCLCIWISRNNWIFNQEDPTIQDTRRNFLK